MGLPSVAIVGLAATTWRQEHDVLLDDLVFGSVSAALREAGLSKHEIDLSVVASMDIYDARAISSAITIPAAGGYLSDSYRLEGDVGEAIIAAARAIRAGDGDVAVAVGVFNPEIPGISELDRDAELEHLSNLGFEPHFDRPVAMTSTTATALHATAMLESHACSLESLARLAADEITRGSVSGRGLRPSATVNDVLASPVVAWPLHRLMLPATSAGAAAVVLASEARARRCRNIRGRLTGWGMATGDYSWSGTWLEHAGEATRRAARVAYQQAGIHEVARGVDIVELTAPTPALGLVYQRALGITYEGPHPIVSPFGGALSNYPGLANGGLRLIQAVDWLDAHSNQSPSGAVAVVHSVDVVTGPVAETATVLVLSAI